MREVGVGFLVLLGERDSNFYAVEFLAQLSEFVSSRETNRSSEKPPTLSSMRERRLHRPLA
jgi:hypothetical protein